MNKKPTAATTTTTNTILAQQQHSSNGHQLPLSVVQMRMASALKTIVSKKKRRYVGDGFNLDLSYIGSDRRIIAMGFPAENMESIYRNSLDEVKRFLDKKHEGHYFIYNLCSERFYDKKKFDNRVATYPFDDHHPPDFSIIKPFCEHVDEWLAQDPKNVAVVHCKAGKGRTGVMICCYLLHSRRFSSADEVLRFYDEERTTDLKGVTIPSQRRYIDYYAKLQRTGVEYRPVKLFLSSIVLSPAPQLSIGNEFYLSFEVKQGSKKLYSSSDYPVKRGGGAGHVVAGGHHHSGGNAASGASTSALSSGPSSSSLQSSNVNFQIDLPEPLLVCSDVKIEFSSKIKMDMIGIRSKYMAPKKEFHLWFNTFFVDSAFSTSSGLDVARAAEAPAPPRARQGHNSSTSNSSTEESTGSVSSNGHGHGHLHHLQQQQQPDFIKGEDTRLFRVSYPSDKNTSPLSSSSSSKALRGRHATKSGDHDLNGAADHHEDDHHHHVDADAEDDDLSSMSNLMKQASVSDDFLHQSKDDTALGHLRRRQHASGRPHHQQLHHQHSHHHPTGPEHSSHPSVHHTIHSVSSSSSSCSSSSHQLLLSSSSSKPTPTTHMLESFLDGDRDKRQRHRSVPQPTVTTTSTRGALRNPVPKHLTADPLPAGRWVSLVLTKDQIDRVHKDKQCKSVPMDFKVTLFFLRPNDQSDAMNYSSSPSCPVRSSPPPASAAGAASASAVTAPADCSSEEDTTDSEPTNGQQQQVMQPLQRASSYQPPITAQAAAPALLDEPQHHHQQHQQQQPQSQPPDVIQSDWI